MSVVVRVWTEENPTERIANQCSVVMRQKLTINPKMLSVVSAGVTTAGMGGGMDRLGGGGGGPGAGARDLTAAAAAATREHRQMRLHTDITINLPPSIEMPDGEEHPYTSSRLHIRDAEQESEIYQKCIRPPPNRTVLESESPPPYRSCSAGMLSTSSSSSSGSGDWSTSSPSNPLVVRCHSMSSTSSKSSLNAATPAIQKTDFLQRTVKIFTGGGKKTVYQQPPPAPALPVVIVPTVVKMHRGAPGAEHRSKHHHDV
ncbi:unnamed protein product [Phyllotreta striolata]|uniref:Uncharacterized protein n=1 Tax=Phyllotreta striolata TaxID=444603 RepID=A0A9N9TVB6_PHYSR|nr:unnamed protein product [Phyllotreta striolata]